jgi:hypothetical protein
MNNWSEEIRRGVWDGSIGVFVMTREFGPHLRGVRQPPVQPTLPLLLQFLHFWDNGAKPSSQAKAALATHNLRGFLLRRLTVAQFMGERR